MGADPEHVKTRNTLRAGGLVLTGVGGIMALIGLVDFFGSMNSFGPPKLFWMVFVGILLVGIGLKMTGAGYLGAITRYGAGEVAPVAKDALEYLKDPSHSSTDLVPCPECGTRGRPDARFCDSCGAAMGKICSGCSTRNDLDSKFCDNCGRDLAATS